MPCLWTLSVTGRSSGSKVFFPLPCLALPVADKFFSYPRPQAESTKKVIDSVVKQYGTSKKSPLK